MLGGRRVNNNIYCGPHNRGFSPLAAAIGAQLKAINALLAVRPDHADAAKPHRYVSPEGEQLIIFDGKVTSEPPRDLQNRDSHHIRLMLGGADGLKAITYIALTFFAHYFQAHARMPGLQPVKDFVLGIGENEFIWWESTNTHPPIGQNPFAFGHTIAVMTSASTGQAIAFISLFGSLNFGVMLGELEGLSDQTVVTFINPLAEKAQRSLQALTNKIEEWTFAKEMQPVLERLNALRGLQKPNRKDEITAVVHEQLRRVYRLMRYLVDEFARTPGDAMRNRLIQILADMLRINPPPAPTFNEAGDLAMGITLGVFVNTIDEKLDLAELDMDYLWALFSGDHGLEIAGRIVFEVAAKQL